MPSRWNATTTLVALLCALHATICLAQDPSAAKVTHLFTSWYGIDAGTAVFKVDRTKVEPESLRILEQVKGYYKIELTDGDSPPKRVNVPWGVRVRAEVASKSEPWLVSDKAWEAGGVGVNSVIHDGGKFRAWYGASTAARDKVVVAPNGKPKLASEGGSAALCYLESDDVHWQKPSLAMIEFDGPKDNNIVSTDGVIIGGSIFLDPQSPSDERYKMVNWRRLPEPLWPESFNNDGSPVAYFDVQSHKYVLFTRANYPRRRSIARAETADFHRWPHPVIVLTPGPDELPTDDFYDNPHLQYPGAASAHLMLVSTYHRDTSLVDMRLATSMDGAGWNWLSPRTVVELGKPGAWDGGMLFAVPDMVRLPDGRAAVAFQGTSAAHEEVWRTKFERGRAAQQGSAWAIWEDGRIAGIEAPTAGEFTTLPLSATGSPIEVNARTGSAGSVRVDVLVGPEMSEPALRSPAMTGDLRWQAVTWEHGDPSTLAGKTIRLRFHLYNAKVFGVRAAGLELVSSYQRK